MTNREIRNRRDRNKRVWWFIQDTLGLLSLFVIGYMVLFIGRGLGL